MLKLGNFQWGIDDLPTSITIGYKLQNTVVRLSDGSRFLQEFGTETEDIQFTGTFRYGNAVQRAQSIQQMFQARVPVTFLIDSFNSPVVITAFKMTIKNLNEVDYDITMFVDDPTSYTLQNAVLDTVTAQAQQGAAQVARSGVTAAAGPVDVVNQTLGVYGVTP